MNLGEFNLLKADEFTDHGVYLADSNDNVVLLPGKFIPDDLKIGDTIEVFLYTDSEDRLVATTQKPKLMLGEIGYLQVVGTSKHGAFLDWGLEKDLFVPFKNQREKMKDGQSYFVTMYVDDFSDRIVATERIGFLFQKNPDFSEGKEYKALVYEETPIGYKIYAEGPCRGMLYKNELHKALSIGEEISVYIKNIRPDGKIDFKLERGDGGTVEALANKILDALAINEGKLYITDKSPADEIAELFDTSKKLFKKSLGLLYRKRKVIICDGHIELC